MRERIMIIGAAGQIGSELTLALRTRYGGEKVYATDVKQPPPDIADGGPFQVLDVMDDKMLIHFVIRNKITHIYHLAAVLSGNAEKFPIHAWQINMESLLNILEVARLVETVKMVFWPSSIAVFGPSTPKKDVPQLTVMEPTTVYGISKLAGERWCEYYHVKHGIDIRSLRYPGLISYKTEAGGGTTDYAVEIYYEALRNKFYSSFIEKDSKMPFLFMPDAINATIKLMEAERGNMTVPSSYNIGGMTLSPGMIFEDIKRHLPEMKIAYKPDFRQAIANSWPESIDDSSARHDWNYRPEYDLHKMTDIMIREVSNKLNKKAK